MNKLALDDFANGMAIIFLLIILGIVGLFFIAAPICGIVAAGKLGATAFETIEGNLTFGIIGTALNFGVGGFWAAEAICEISVNPPIIRDNSNWSDPVWTKWTIAITIAIVLWLGICALGVHFAIMAFESANASPLLAGKIFKSLHSVGLVLFGLGGIGKLFILD